MDNNESSSRPSYTTIDIEDHDWNDTEEIELGYEEHDLFLQENYVEPTNKDILPFRVVPNSKDNEAPTTQRSQNNNEKQAFLDDDGLSYSKFQIDDSGVGSGSTSSIVYQAPNFEQFAGNLAPTSPTSIIASLVIVLLILSVTILPIILPQGSSDDTGIITDNVINKNPSMASVEHADARCKCICPPLAEDDKKSSNSSAQSTKKRRLYLGNTEPNKCNCLNIVQPHLVNVKIEIGIPAFCIQCECKYQNRNTTTIKRIVIFFSAVLTTLTLFMLVQYLLKYFRITRRNLPPKWRWLSHQITDTD